MPSTHDKIPVPDSRNGVLRKCINSSLSCNSVCAFVTPRHCEEHRRCDVAIRIPTIQFSKVVLPVPAGGVPFLLLQERNQRTGPRGCSRSRVRGEPLGNPPARRLRVRYALAQITTCKHRVEIVCCNGMETGRLHLVICSINWNLNNKRS